MRCFHVPSGVANLYMPDKAGLPRGMVQTVFDDGRISTFVPPDKPDYREAARLFGYGDCFIDYGLEHDLLHHWVAKCLGWPCSPVIWNNAHRALPDWQPKDDVWPFHPNGWHEEHIVNYIQRYIKTSEIDAEHGVLHGLWGDRGLILVAAGFINWLTGADLDNVKIPEPLIDTMAIAKKGLA
jgi:hypothetical protein